MPSTAQTHIARMAQRKLEVSGRLKRCSRATKKTGAIIATPSISSSVRICSTVWFCTLFRNVIGETPDTDTSIERISSDSVPRS